MVRQQAPHPGRDIGPSKITALADLNGDLARGDGCVYRDSYHRSPHRRHIRDIADLSLGSSGTFLPVKGGYFSHGYRHVREGQPDLSRHYPARR
jgi:hypothetical protein